MRESWRWFGPDDPVSLDDIRQTGATDIVSALYDIPAGEPWTLTDIRAYQDMIEGGENSPLRWSVVESIPVHEHIKMGKPDIAPYIAAFIETMENLAVCGIKTIVYNFMPVVDATRTELYYRLPSGATALRFDQQQLCVFDLFILERSGAEKDYSADEMERAGAVFQAMSDQDKGRLSQNIMAGLPGRMTDSYHMPEFKKALAQYEGIDRQQLQNNLYHFLSEILPAAERLGVKLAIHPDDPPRGMFGLPRIICTADDLEDLFRVLPSPANGVTLCVGTFGSRPDNDLPAMARKFGSRIFFSHLRGVKKDREDPRSFYEAAHLDSDVDIIAVIEVLLQEEKRREKDAMFKGDTDIPIRPDHGHQMMDDLHKSGGNPGYTAIGRLRGLAEIRGVIRTLKHLF